MGPFAPTVPLTSFHCVPIVTVPVVHSLNNSEVNRVNVNKGRERRESAHRTFPSFVHFSLSLHPSLTFSPLFANEGNEGRTVGESKSEGYGRVNQWEHWALLRSHCFPSSPVHFSLFPLVRLFRALTHSPRVNKREKWTHETDGRGEWENERTINHWEPWVGKETKANQGNSRGYFLSVRDLTVSSLFQSHRTVVNIGTDHFLLSHLRSFPQKLLNL